VFTALMAQAEADEDLNWAVSMDSPSYGPISTRPGPKTGPPADERCAHALDRPEHGNRPNLGIAA